MHNIITFINSIPPQAWTVLFGGSFVAVAVEVLKRILKTRAALVIRALTSVVSALVAILPIYIGHPETMQLFGAYSAGLFTAANIVYAAAKFLLPRLAAIGSGLTAKKSAPATVTSDQAIAEAPTYEG